MTILPSSENPMPILETGKSVISLAATCIGLVVIVVGLKYAMDIFQLIFTILESPSQLTDPLQQLAESFGGSAFDLKIKDRAVPLANLMALAVYCFGAFLSAWLTLALMQTGAKIVSLTAGDRSAVKKILQSAFGSSMQPKIPDAKDGLKTRNTSQTDS